MAASSYDIPLGGNAYITHRRNPDAPEVITNSGLGNWMDSDTICSLMFHIHYGRDLQAQGQGATSEIAFDFSLRLYVAGANGAQSMIRVALKQAGWCTGGPQEFYTHITGIDLKLCKT